MKLITAVVPCYNSEEYMCKAINSLLSGGAELEIILVNDGSTDRTGEIANKYQADYPDMIKVVHQDNGGHGEAINTGLVHATGLYFKVVDSDDWVSESALKQVVTRLRELTVGGSIPDLFLANYVYMKNGVTRNKVISYNSALVTDRLFTWNEVGHFKLSQNILMHSAIYRTSLLKECGLVLPMHTFYVDNIFVYQPLPFVKTLYYMDVNLYCYYIGRADQSVNEQVMIRRVDQQIKITKIMIDSHNLMSMKQKELKSYMIKYLTMMVTVCTVLLVKEGSEESLKKKIELWDYIKMKDQRLYKKIKSQVLGRSINLPGRLGTRVIEVGYHISRRIYGYN